MHGAPSVSYPVGRSRFGAALSAVAWACGAAAWLGWLLLGPAPGWRQWLGLAVLAGVGLFALAAWRSAPAGRLAWDGEHWRWSAPVEGAGCAQDGKLAMGMDLQHWLLLHWLPLQGRPLWLWLSRKDDPQHWDALRRAVYFRARTEVPHRAQPPVA
jgi:toxin CptA